MSNANLIAARQSKNDEFYTRLEDIEKELEHYRQHFQGKTVYCNSNDNDSNFHRFFTEHFAELGLKKAIFTGYSKGKHGEAVIYDGKTEYHTILNGDGDFRSTECVEFLKESDIVVSNPAFSMFREYIAQLMEYRKKFLVIGNKNAITYKEVFPLIKDNKIWLGVTSPKTFLKPDGTIRKFGNIGWFTNLEHHKRHEKLFLTKHFSEKYVTYDNYTAIEVSRTCYIPVDYDGYMGVPITFIDKYNPEQFQIIGMMSVANGYGFVNGNDGRKKLYLGGKGVYARIIIKHIRR